VQVTAPTALTGRIVTVRITEVSANSLFGVVLAAEDGHLVDEADVEQRLEVPAGA
jgi:TRAM domain